MESERLRDYILGRAFKAVRFDSKTRRLAPEYALKAYENDEIEKIAREEYCYTRDEYIRFKTAVLTSRAVNAIRANELTLPEIGNGDILEITGPQSECLRLLKLQGCDFLVLADDTLDARPGDVMSMLQYVIRLDHQALFQLRRGAGVIPARDKAYSISKVCALMVIHSDAALYSDYLQSTSDLGVTASSATKAYGNVFDLAFNGFAGPQLDLEQRGQLYEIDPINLTYRVNPAYNPGRVSRQALLQELSNGFLIEEQADDFTRIVHVADGQLALSPREGYNILTCKRQATISLC